MDLKNSENIPHEYARKRIPLEWAYFENLLFTTEEPLTELKRQATLRWQTRQGHDIFGCATHFTNRIVDIVKTTGQQKCSTRIPDMP